ncbi:MAG: BTAD domain-containing putative transcriptional regulator [Gammaproteobacteria bacterium]
MFRGILNSTESGPLSFDEGRGWVVAGRRRRASDGASERRRRSTDAGFAADRALRTFSGHTEAEARGEPPDLLDRYRAWIGAVERLLYAGRNYRELDPWIERADASLDALPAPLSLMARAALFEALQLRKPEDPRLPGLARDLAGALYDLPRGRSAAVLANRLMRYFVWGGDLSEAASLMAFVRHAQGTAQTDEVEILSLYATEALYAWASGDAPLSQEAVAAGLVRATDGSASEWVFQLSVHGVYASLCSRDELQLHRFLAQARDSLAESGGVEECHYRLLASLVALTEQDFSEAVEQARLALALSRQLGAPLIEGFARLALCRCAADQAESIAEPVLQEIAALARGSRNRLLEHLVLLLDAQRNLQTGARRKVASQLRRAFRLVREWGHTSLPWWSERSLTLLCETALRSGIERDYVQCLIARHQLVPTHADVDDWPYRLRVFTLGRFAVLKEEVPVRFDRKPQRKPMDLLKVIIALGGRGISVERVCGILWPEAEGDAAHHAFETTVYRLRRLIGVEQAVVVESGRISLDNRYCWVDAWAFERVLSKVDRIVKTDHTPRRRAHLRQLTDRALGLYHGHFLGQEEGEPWTIRQRERLRSKFIRELGTIGRYWEEMQEWDLAIACYQKGLDVDDLIETFYQRLIACCGAVGRKAEALVYYRRCRRTLSIVLGVSPAPETDALVQSLLRIPAA